MKKVKTNKIKLIDIKHIDNSRMRGKDDVSELMHDIEQRGLLQSVGIRVHDNALIYGNRRVRAYEKLGYDEIEADFFDDLNDEDLLIANLAENIQRKGLGSVEIGRVCKMLVDKGLTNSEIAQKLSINVNRVRACITAYTITVGTPFEKLVKFSVGRGTKHGGIPESLIWDIQSHITRGLGRKITKYDWDILLRSAEEGKLHTKNVNILKYILINDTNKDLVKALGILDKVKIIYFFISLNRNAYEKAKRKIKIDNDVEFMKHVIKNYDEDLIF